MRANATIANAAAAHAVGRPLSSEQFGSGSPPPQLRTVRLKDWEQIHRLEMAHFPVSPSYDDWSGLWLENPLWPRLGDRWPLGWLLEDSADRVVGSLLNIPTSYHFQGLELINAAGRAWTVDRAYRGYALWLLDEFYNQPGVDLFISNTVNQLAERAHRSYAAPVPQGDWKTISFWITGYRGFARKVLQKKRVPLASLLAAPAGACLRLRDLFRAEPLPPPTNGIAVEAASEFDARFDAFWHETLRQNPNMLLATRDARTLAWHYTVPQRCGRLWIYTATRPTSGCASQLRAYSVFKRQDGDDGIRRMRLVDYQTLEPNADLLADMLSAALKRCLAEGLYALDLLGSGLHGLETFDRCAPYRHNRPHWAYWYRAADPTIARALRTAETWNPSSYDADASFD